MPGDRELSIEKYLCKKVKERGGRAEKLVFFSKAGAPDRYCFFKGGHLFPVECKAENGKLHPLQKLELERLERDGFTCFVVYSKEDVDMAVAAMTTIMTGTLTLP